MTSKVSSLSDISSIQSFHRMQAAATPVPLFTADQTTVLTFCLKSPLSLRRQQDLEKKYYQNGALETWVIFLPLLGIYFVAEVSHLTSPCCFPAWATQLRTIDSFFLFLTFRCLSPVLPYCGLGTMQCLPPIRILFRDCANKMTRYSSDEHLHISCPPLQEAVIYG